jgi:hypothetical protein
MSDFNGERRYVLYQTFYIGDEAHSYFLHLEDYSGTAGMRNHTYVTFFIYILSLTNVYITLGDPEKMGPRFPLT